jgi:hypothetical protein
VRGPGDECTLPCFYGPTAVEDRTKKYSNKILSKSHYLERVLEDSKMQTRTALNLHLQIPNRCRNLAGSAEALMSAGIWKLEELD